ncbi:MAG: putative glycoside hydrolase [Lachnospiraceae bacterium]|nr:putative glycoside hydrolase [Lachnospiraceae bacterium]
MFKNRDQYLDRNLGYTPGKRRRKKGNGVIIVSILLIIFAFTCGVTGYKLAKKYLGEGKNPDELNRFLNENGLTPGAGPTLAAGISLTPTWIPTPIPTTFVKPGIDDPYLADFVDNRDPLANIRAAGFDTSIYDDDYPFQAKGVYAGHIKKNTKVYDNVTWLAGFTELNAVIIDVRDDFGYITYDMDVDLVKELDLVAPRDGKHYTDDMPGLLRELHSRGIYCIARIVCFKESYFTYSPIAKYRSDWLIKNKDGSVFRDKTNLNGTDRPYAWMNVYNPEVMDFIVDISMQAARDGFDEICYDYMRAPAYDEIGNGSEIDFDFDNCMDQISKFIRYACNSLKPLGVYVSGSVFGITIDLDGVNIGQGYEELSKYFDYICPMIYPSSFVDNYLSLFGVDSVHEHPYDLISYLVRKSEKKLKALKSNWDGPVAKCRPWLQAGAYDYTKVREQILGSEDNGIFSWMLWNSAVEYDQDFFLTLEEAKLKK